MGTNWPPDDDNSSEKSKRIGTRLWYFIKIVEYVLIAICILLLMLNEYLSVIKDDFTPAYSNNTAKNYPPEKKIITTTTARSRSGERRRFKRGNDEHHPHHHPDLKMSYLLILYPCCTTIAIFFSMELLGRAFKDPLNKFSNFILLAVCTMLCIAVFTVGLICAIDSVHISMILVSVLSGALLIAIFIDLVLLIIC